jgi:hypothetical protein
VSTTRRSRLPQVPLGGPILVGLVVVRILVVGIGFARVAAAPVTDDYVLRFHEIAVSEGRPYRDVAVEYPPGELIGIEAVGRGSAASTARWLLVLNLGADLAIAAMVFRAWGRRAGAWYLLLGTPILWFSYLGFDLPSVALAVGGIVLARRGNERTGGVVMAVAVWTRLWPAVVVPALWMGGRRRAVWWTLGSSAALLAAWVAYAGLEGPRQVLTFRGARGWEFESLIGAVWWIVAGSARAVSEAGASRFGVAPLWAKGILAGLAVAGIGLAWRRSRGVPAAIGKPALAAVAVLLCCSPLLSYPFVVWVLPWAAIAGEEGDDGSRMRGLAMGVVLLTAAAVASFGSKERLPWLTQGSLVARNVLLVVIVVMWVTKRWVGREPEDVTASARPVAGAAR